MGGCCEWLNMEGCYLEPITLVAGEINETSDNFFDLLHQNETIVFKALDKVADCSIDIITGFDQFFADIDLASLINIFEKLKLKLKAEGYLIFETNLEVIRKNGSFAKEDKIIDLSLKYFFEAKGFDIIQKFNWLNWNSDPFLTLIAQKVPDS